MLHNADCTIFNKYYDLELKMEIWKRTVLQNIHWKETNGIRFIKSGRSCEDNAVVTIPFHSAENIKFLSHRQFNGNRKIFTLKPGDRIAKGVISEDIGDNGLKDFLQRYDLLEITSVDTVDYGSPARHCWIVGAK